MKFKEAIKYLKKTPNNSISIFLFHGIINKNSKSNTVTNYNNKHLPVNKFQSFLREISKF